MAKKDYNHIDQEIEKALDSLEGIKPAQTDPYFLSRLEARIARENQNPESIWEFLLQPKMSLSIALYFDYPQYWFALMVW